MLLYDGHCTDCPERLVQARGGEPRRDPQRVLENSSITFISPKKPECRVSAANIWCSSGYFQPPRLSAALLSGAKQMPSSPPSSGRPIICSSVSPASRPDLGGSSTPLIRAGATFPG